MIRLHERIPSPARSRAASDRVQLDAAQIRQRSVEVRHILEHGARPALPRLRLVARWRQLDQTPALQLQEIFAARHLLRPAEHVAPAEVLAYLPRQPLARQSRVLAHALMNPGDALGRSEALACGVHAYTNKRIVFSAMCGLPPAHAPCGGASDVLLHSRCGSRTPKDESPQSRGTITKA